MNKDTNHECFVHNYEECIFSLRMENIHLAELLHAFLEDSAQNTSPVITSQQWLSGLYDVYRFYDNI